MKKLLNGRLSSASLLRASDVSSLYAHASASFEKPPTHAERAHAHIASPRDVQSLLLWLFDATASPSWLFLRNKALLTHAVMLFITSTAPGMHHAGAVAYLNRESPLLRLCTRYAMHLPKRAWRSGEHRIGDAADEVLHVREVQVESAGGKRRREGLESHFDQPEHSDRASCVYDMCLTAGEMLANGFPVLPTPTASGYMATRTAEADFTRAAPTRTAAGRVRVHAQPAAPRLLALDCEMCRTGEGRMQLARVSVVDELERCVMDEIILPEQPIVDHLTEFSGITPHMIASATCSLTQAAERLAALLDGDATATTEEARAPAVLVGHSLENDMHALRLVHSRIIDTSILHPHPGGLPYRHSLRHLVRQRLDRSIQEGHGTVGHSSAEDALAAMHLVELLLPAVHAAPDADATAAVAAPQPFETFFTRPARDAFLPSPDVQLHWQRRDASTSDATPTATASAGSAAGVSANAGIGQTLAALQAGASSSSSSPAPSAAAPARRGRSRSSLFEHPSLCTSSSFVSARLIGDASFVRHHVGGTADGIAVPAGAHTPRKILERVTAEVVKYETAHASESLSRKHGLVVAAIQMPPPPSDASSASVTGTAWSSLDALLASWLPTLPRGCAVMVITQPSSGAVDANERDPITGGVAGAYGTLFLHVTSGRPLSATDREASAADAEEPGARAADA